MIPVYRSTVTRLDLSSVLNYMVEDFIHSGGVGDILSQECAERTRCDYAIATCSLSDAMRAACYLAGATVDAQCAVFLPVLAPLTLYNATIHDTCMKPFLYDVHSDICTEPSHEAIKAIAEIKQSYEVSLFVRCVHFGMHNERMFSDQHAHKSITVDIQTTPYVEDVVHSHEKTMHSHADIIIIDCGFNTIFTSGGGAIVCVRGKKFARALRSYKKFLTPLQDINASLALAQLKQMDTFSDRTKKLTKTMLGALVHSRHTVSAACFDEKSLLQTLPLFLESRKKEILNFAHKHGIECTNAFSMSILAYLCEGEHSQSQRLFFPSISYKQYPQALSFLSHFLCFPLYPSLDNEEVIHLAKVLSSLP